MTKIIDTHHHFLPDFYVKAAGEEALARVMPSRTAPSWSEASTLEWMDSNGITEVILSLSSGPRLEDPVAVLRRCNDYVAELRGRHPGRFGSFASLPMPNIDASLAEIEHSCDKLKCDGFILFTNYDGDYLGERRFRPVLEELNRRNAIVLIHPTEIAATIGRLPASILEFPFDTTRTVGSLIAEGVITELPNIRFILSHAGGVLPFMAMRLLNGLKMNPALAERIGDPGEILRSFWYDLAVSVSPGQIAALRCVARPDRILFGSDFPMAPAAMSSRSLKQLGTMFEGPQLAGVYASNAALLLNRPSD